MFLGTSVSFVEAYHPSAIGHVRNSQKRVYPEANLLAPRWVMVSVRVSVSVRVGIQFRVRIKFRVRVRVRKMLRVRMW